MKKNLVLLLILVVLGGLAYTLYSSNDKSTISSNQFTDFAIEDTSSVSKIIIVDKVTGTVTLSRDREKGIWLLDGKYRAKDQSVEICLQAIKNVVIRGNVPKNMHKTIISKAAGSGKKIEIYTDDSKVPEKIWISAGNTSDHHGDYFILQIPGVGISPEPFMVDMPMFAGFLTARFHTEFNDWRYSGIFNYPNLGFKSITVEETAAPQNSFSLDWDGSEGFLLKTFPIGNPLENVNLSNAKDYLLRYKKIHLETFNTHLTEHETDSILNKIPDWKVSVTGNDNETKTLSMFYLPGEGNYHDFEDNELPYNQDIMYATVDGKELFRVQYAFVVKPLLEPLSYFLN